ncbi:hypothetical protein [Croceicoccus pelagius]|uniref:Uncharacterized protein n=1 Tax=Croceicoccus pelagius TaxID=1703341 RepID=A0A916Y992_9SPHN|nr:hypothetical protein [Croceicoccus pelagius]GGD35085.1 hypothetical protein GCM10010989_06540 [Croceicoccus pelagius]
MQIFTVGDLTNQMMEGFRLPSRLLSVLKELATARQHLINVDPAYDPMVHGELTAVGAFSAAAAKSGYLTLVEANAKRDGARSGRHDLILIDREGPSTAIVEFKIGWPNERKPNYIKGLLAAAVADVTARDFATDCIRLGIAIYVPWQAGSSKMPENFAQSAIDWATTCAEEDGAHLSIRIDSSKGPLLISIASA